MQKPGGFVFEKNKRRKDGCENLGVEFTCEDKFRVYCLIKGWNHG